MPNPNTLNHLYSNVAEDEKPKNETQINKDENTEIHNISNRFRAIDELTPVKECVK